MQPHPLTHIQHIETTAIAQPIQTNQNHHLHPRTHPTPILRYRAIPQKYIQKTIQHILNQHPYAWVDAVI